MKSKIHQLLLLVVSVLTLLNTACTNSKVDNQQNKETMTDSFVSTNDSSLSNVCVNPESDNDTEDNTSVENEVPTDKESRFNFLRNNWIPQIVDSQSTPTVIDFMNTIKNHYSINIEKDSESEMWEEIYDVDQGYCSVGIRPSNNHIYCTVWNKNNGHKIIPFMYGSIHFDNAICFYDYNPQNRELIVDTVLTDRFKGLDTRLYNKYGFHVHDEKSADSFEDDYYSLHIWNGNGFDEYADEGEYIKKAWKPQKVKAISRTGKPSVVDYMRTFTDFYGYTYVKDDELYKEDIRKGYCSLWSSDNVIECVMWNRNNKHVLVCFSLITYYKDDCNCGPDCFGFYFFDYNPQTQLMSAETGLTKKFEPIISKLEVDYEFGSVIPIEGKNIKLDNKIFKWNGYDFNFPK